MGVYEKWENIKENITAVILKQPSSRRGREDEIRCNMAFWAITRVRGSLHYNGQKNLPFSYSSSANTVLQSPRHKGKFPMEKLAVSFNRKYVHLVQHTIFTLFSNCRENSMRFKHKWTHSSGLCKSPFHHINIFNINTTWNICRLFNRFFKGEEILLKTQK